MPWLIGIDEAGYGPNLGPFVMSSVACRVPQRHAEADLWQLLQSAVRRQADAVDQRLVIDDSKLVYSPARGLLDLETAVLATLQARSHQAVGAMLEQLCPEGLAELRREAWFDGETSLPRVAMLEAILSAAKRFAAASAAVGLVWGPVCSAVVCPTRFNQMLDRWGTKGAILGQCLNDLLQRCRELGTDDTTVRFYVDKHGGRNTYSAMLQDAFPSGFVAALEEGMNRSTYQVLGLSSDIQLSFQPRADGSHLVVALASMISKYLREVLMEGLNRYWQKHVPGLKPTAGYPVDATRFFARIRTLLPAPALANDQVWRRK